MTRIFTINNESEIDTLLSRYVTPFVNFNIGCEFDIEIGLYILRINTFYMDNWNRSDNYVTLGIIDNKCGEYIYPLKDNIIKNFPIITNFYKNIDSRFSILYFNMGYDLRSYLKEIILVLLKVNKLLAFS